MSGVIGIPANDAARYTFFAASLTSLHHPPNTSVRWSFGSDRIRGRNNLVKDALDQGAEWLWFLDDDHAFRPDMLMRLLAHDVPIVTPVYLQRMMPFAPVVYADREGENYTTLFLPDHPPSGDPLVEICAAGTGGMLIRTEVFRSMEEPYFEHGRASEDLIFCDKARALGYSIYCDLSAHLGHLTAAVIWPVADVEADEWAVGFTIADSATFSIPVGTREQLEEMQDAEKRASAEVQKL